MRVIGPGGHVRRTKNMANAPPVSFRICSEQCYLSCRAGKLPPTASLEGESVSEKSRGWWVGEHWDRSGISPLTCSLNKRFFFLLLNDMEEDMPVERSSPVRKEHNNIAGVHRRSTNACGYYPP